MQLSDFDNYKKTDRDYSIAAGYINCTIDSINLQT